MASSQVEIALSSPFGCVLKNHNRQDRCRESNTRATQGAFQKDLRNFVRDHLNSCSSISSDSAPDEDTHNQININDADSWISNRAKNNLGNPRSTRSNQNKKEKDDSSLVSPRQSQIIDRWAARKAREMVSTIETGAELLALPNLENFPSRPPSSTSKREDSPAPSDGSSEISNLGASSLVQIWEKRLNQSNDTKSNTVSSPGKSSPRASCNENAFTVEEQCRGSEAGESTDEIPVNDESFSDWVSDNIGASCQTCSLQAQNSDATESERVRVADIIKRLSSINQMQSSLSCSDDNDQEQYSNMTGSPSRERDRAYTLELPEHRTFHQVISSPRIRGRRAFTDMLMQMERDRHRELNNLAERGAVSKFTQKGRIQSLLRLRLLQRGQAAYDQCRQHSTTSEVNRQTQGSNIVHLRERFSAGVVHGTRALTEVANPKSPRMESVSISHVDKYPNPSQLSKDNYSKTVHGTSNHYVAPTKNSVSQSSKDHSEKAHPRSEVRIQGACSEAPTVASQEIPKTTSMADSNANEIEDDVEAKYDSGETYGQTMEEEEASEQQYAESSYDEIVEDVEASEQNYDESYHDWISGISRPRSYWEDRRQAWYKEMLDNGSDNGEIRQLIERRTVSTFLSSDFRERMDKLMESHIGTQTHLVNCQEDEEDNRGRMDQLIAFLQEHMRPAGNPEDEGERGEEDRRQEEEKAEEEGSLINDRYHEVSDYFNQSSSSTHMPSPFHSSTWSYRENEVSDDSDRVESISSAEPSQSQSQSFYRENQQYSSSTNHHSIEMELIYDLRGHMDQLYQEMAELRKSIRSCMDMQMVLQQSMTREVHTVKEKKKSHDRALKKGNCCICYEMKVDSLLYRCGHMCACLKCANELQWNSGKCPICRAPIVDVVRVYLDA